MSKLKQERVDRLGMDSARWHWTLRLIQGLALEVERRGYVVAAPPAVKSDNYGYVSREKRAIGHLRVCIGEDEVDMHFNQARELVPRLLTASELRRKEEGYQVSNEEYVKTDFLTVRLTGLDPAFWKPEWTETDTTRADSFLPQIIQEIELRAARAVERRHENQRRENEKRRKWEQVRGRAIERLNEESRAKVLLDQAERFQRVQQLGEYIAALKSHIQPLNPVDAAAAAGWVQWAEAHAGAINPMLGDLRMPDDPKPDAAALKPYMNAGAPMARKGKYGGRAGRSNQVYFDPPLTHRKQTIINQQERL